MSTYPAVAKTKITNTGVIKTTIARPKAYYSRAGSVRLAVGQVEVEVEFTTPLKDANWIFGGMTIWNSADAEIDAVFVNILGRTAKSQSGFTVLITPPPSDNYYLDWTIAEEFNP